MSKKMLSISEVSNLLGVTIKTLKIWDNEGKLKAKYKTSGGHRRYDIDDINKFVGTAEKDLMSVGLSYIGLLSTTYGIDVSTVDAKSSLSIVDIAELLSLLKSVNTTLKGGVIVEDNNESITD